LKVSPQEALPLQPPSCKCAPFYSKSMRLFDVQIYPSMSFISPIFKITRTESQRSTVISKQLSRYDTMIHAFRNGDWYVGSKDKIKGMRPYQLGYMNWNMAVVIHSKYRLTGVMVSVLTCRAIDRRLDYPSDQTGLLN